MKKTFVGALSRLSIAYMRVYKRLKGDIMGMDICNACKQVKDSREMFVCECGYHECAKCWYARTRGFSEEGLLAPFWVCPNCGVRTELAPDGSALKPVGGS